MRDDAGDSGTGSVSLGNWDGMVADGPSCIGSMKLSSTSSIPIASKRLDVVELDQYLISLLVGRTITQCCLLIEKLLQKLQTSRSSNSVPAVISLLIQQCFQTIGKSASWQSTIIQFLTIISTRGTTPGCHAVGIQVVENDTFKNKQQKQGQRTSLRFYSRLLVYAILQVLLPQIYQIIKTKYINRQRDMVRESDEESDDIDAYTRNQHLKKKVQLLAQTRRQFVIQKSCHVIDTIMPILRLGFLLRCWSSSWYNVANDPVATSPNIALTLSGLTYQNMKTSHSIHNISSNFFVLFAYRRWMHYQGMLSWSMIGVPIIHALRDAYTTLRQLLVDDNHLVQYWIEQFQQRRRRIQMSTVGHCLTEDKSDSNNTNNANESSCPLCEAKPMTIPYQIQDCHHVVCYTCLWDYILKKKKQRYIREEQKQVNFSVPCPVCYCNIRHCQPI